MDCEKKYQQAPEPKYECLLFDLDDTLYPLNSGLSVQITKNIREYMVHKLHIEESAVPELCLSLYKNYGTTMAGLKALGYNFDYDDFHGFVHGTLPYNLLKPDPVLRHLLHSLPIRKFIFTNADKAHAARVLARLGLEDCFDGIICFETLNPTNKSSASPDEKDNNLGCAQTGPVSLGEAALVGACSGGVNADVMLPKSPVVCKPFEEAFEQAFKILNINSQRTVFFEDSVRNLQTGKQMGLHTVLVGTAHRTKGVDYALESIHNIREALPELWEADMKSESVKYSGEVAIETSVKA
ncbi:suppressor of disruption of TFIIS [Rhodamnia argentea]|uniref:Suppressor of disruption of TFIIS n=1 Tax=Rhodamnia argentea TaxID=178133 RepID=A0A8B8PS26_9MYRT|nr:suppressor of disruption of TFIIS [Rhodamnia argentea]XP_030537580.1 suppressor of disruption of TFIIS [Rhodamnia argentea]XP_048137134.1 suppressor of disruption of TFIIS [Rhodamnia argentea]